MGKLVGDPATERAVLCALVQHGQEALSEIADLVDSEVFTDDHNRVLFDCVRNALATRKTVDIPTLLSSAHELGYDKFLTEQQDVKYVHSLQKLEAKFENVRQNAIKLRKLEIGRRLQKAAIQSYKDIAEITGGETVDRIISIAEKPIFDVGLKESCCSQEQTILLSKDIDAYLDFLESNPCDVIGIPLPFPTWNAAVGGGCRRGSTSLIVARPKSGKTTTVVNTANHVSSLGIPVLVLDTEMSKNDIVHKSVSNLCRVPFLEIETGKFGQDPKKARKVRDAAAIVKTMPIHYRNVAGKAFTDILSIIRRWVVKEVGFDSNGKTNNCLVIYDYFKLQEREALEDMQEYQAMGFQIADITNFAIQYDVPILAFVQSNREGDVKEIGSIVAQSDRLLWLCASLTLLKRKSVEEMLNDGRQNGNAKLVPLESRFGPGMKDGQYISLAVDYSTAHMQELSAKSTEKSFGVENGESGPVVF